MLVTSNALYCTKCYEKNKYFSSSPLASLSCFSLCGLSKNGVYNTQYSTMDTCIMYLYWLTLTVLWYPEDGKLVMCLWMDMLYRKQLTIVDCMPLHWGRYGKIGWITSNQRTFSWHYDWILNSFNSKMLIFGLFKSQGCQCVFLKCSTNSDMVFYDHFGRRKNGRAI